MPSLSTVNESDSHLYTKVVEARRMICSAYDLAEQCSNGRAIQLAVALQENLAEMHGELMAKTPHIAFLAGRLL